MSIAEKKKILDDLESLPLPVCRRAMDIIAGAKMGIEFAAGQTAESAEETKPGR